MLELECKDVPEFTTMSTELTKSGYATWYLELQHWLKRRGYFFLEMHLSAPTPAGPMGVPVMPQPFHPFCILIGYTKKAVRHMIIGQMMDGKLVPVWNPFKGEKIESVEALGFIVPLDPASMKIEPTNVVSIIQP